MIVVCDNLLNELQVCKLPVIRISQLGVDNHFLVYGAVKSARPVVRSRPHTLDEKSLCVGMTCVVT